MLSYNYISGTDVRVVIDVSIMAACRRNTDIISIGTLVPDM